jgi:hypothetical protein
MNVFLDLRPGIRLSFSLEISCGTMIETDFYARLQKSKYYKISRVWTLRCTGVRCEFMKANTQSSNHVVWHSPAVALAWWEACSVHSSCSTGHTRCTGSVPSRPGATAASMWPRNWRTLVPLQQEVTETPCFTCKDYGELEFSVLGRKHSGKETNEYRELWQYKACPTVLHSSERVWCEKSLG